MLFNFSLNHAFCLEKRKEKGQLILLPFSFFSCTLLSKRRLLFLYKRQSGIMQLILDQRNIGKNHLSLRTQNTEVIRRRVKTPWRWLGGIFTLLHDFQIIRNSHLKKQSQKDRKVPVCKMFTILLTKFCDEICDKRKPISPPTCFDCPKGNGKIIKAMLCAATQLLRKQIVKHDKLVPCCPKGSSGVWSSSSNLSWTTLKTWTKSFFNVSAQNQWETETVTTNLA